MKWRPNEFLLGFHSRIERINEFDFSVAFSPVNNLKPSSGIRAVAQLISVIGWTNASCLSVVVQLRQYFPQFVEDNFYS